MSVFDVNSPVALDAVNDYEYDNLLAVIKNQLSKIVPDGFFADKKVVIKPNLVHRCSPDDAATTNPSVLRAAAEAAHFFGAASVLVAESSGGPYTESNLASVYRTCGIEEAAKAAGAELNFDTGFRSLSCPDGEKSKVFNVINPILDADVVINLSKLKTHGLTIMSAAVKNFFGVIPGVQKFEMHARFPNVADFEKMLLDINLALYSNKPIVNICDAIIGMEGNGPTAGSPRKVGALMTSLNPCNIDLVGTHLISLDGKVEMLTFERERGWCPESCKDVRIIGNDPDSLAVTDYKAPQTANSKLSFLLTLGNGRFSNIIAPHPVIDKKTCIGCGVCVRSCPQHTIELKTKKDGSKVAYINKKDCIRCFCCQELCPHRRVKIKTNPIVRIINGTK